MQSIGLSTPKYPITRANLEHSWYQVCVFQLGFDAMLIAPQPAIDAYTVALSRTFNRLSTDSSLQPIVYGTYQAYLQRFVT